MNSVKTKWEARGMRPVGTIPYRSDGIFRGSEPYVFKVIKVYFFVLIFR